MPAEARSRPFAVLVGEAPGEREIEQGRPFVGPAGMELMRGLTTVGIPRGACHITNAVLCLKGPPRGNVERAEKEAKRRNTEWMKKIDDGGNDGADIADYEANYWLDPVEACRPRLMREIAEAAPTGGVVSLGGVAYRAVTGRRERILEVRGGPRDETFGRLLPTLHPSFVLQTRRWTRAFVADLGRAKRWFTTGLSWTDPETTYRPTPSQLRTWIEREADSPFVVHDVETAPGFPAALRYDPQYDNLRVIGLASHDGKRAIVVPFRSVEDPLRMFYTIDDYQRLITIIAEFLASKRWNKVGHNSGYYDRMVEERHFKVTPKPHLDTIGLHKFSEPELPHTLGYVGSVYTDIHAWKQGKTATDAVTDEQLWLYNARDCAVTALSLRPLVQAVTDRGQLKLAQEWFPFLQSMCVDLHKNGMLVDQKKRREWDTKLLQAAREHYNRIQFLVGNDRFNPGSFKQVGALLFDTWDLMPVDYTELGDPSTGDDSLREILAKQDLTPRQREVIEHVRLYRRRTKFRGTYTLKLRPLREDAIGEFYSYDEEETDEEREERFTKEAKKLGIVLEDGRVHSDWNPHGTLGWRLSSSNMNMQNYPNKLRDMIVSPPGRSLVGCDQAQLELRMGAGLAKSEAYLAAFAEDKDPHLQFCLDIFGETYERAKDKKSLRRLVKELTYASEYRAEVDTVHNTLTSAEDDDERLLFPTITMSQVAAMHRKWLARAKFESWWEEEDRTFARQGFLLDPILGLRCDFLDGKDDPQIGNKLVNFRSQSGGAAIVHIATRRFLENMPKEWLNRSKVDPKLWRVMLVQQGHDSLVAEADDDIATDVGKFMEECFTFPADKFGLGVKFLGEMKVGKDWKSV